MKKQEPLTIEELEAQMENAFQEGEATDLALFLWEAIGRFPEKASIARIYLKKVLRNPDIAALSLDDFKKNAKRLREDNEPEESAKHAALGLLLFPKDRYLSLSIVDAAEKLKRDEWLAPAIEPLGQPKPDDVVLQNVIAALAQKTGDYEKSYRIFSRLHAREPENEQFIQSRSAALVGLSRWDEARTMLEKMLPITQEPKAYLHRLTPIYSKLGLDVRKSLETLDEEFFKTCSTAKIARAHADIRMFLQDFPGVIEGLQAEYQFKPSPEVAFEIAEAEFTAERFDSALDRYGVRFEAFPKLDWGRRDLPPYRGEILTEETLYVWGEQGIGDEILFSFFFEELERRVRHVTVAMDARLIPSYQARYPNWRFIDRLTASGEMTNADFVCPSGDLMVLFLEELVAKNAAFQWPLIQPTPRRLEIVHGLMPPKSRPRVAISWRGGTKTNGLIRSMELDDFVNGIPADADVDLISLQYDEGHEEEVKAFGDRRIALSGLNNRLDIDGVLSLMKCCDAVLTVDNAVAHFGAAVGVPTYVILPAGQTQFRWKSPSLKRLVFPKVNTFIQNKPGSWSEVVKTVWGQLLSDVKGDNG